MIKRDDVNVRNEKIPVWDDRGSPSAADGGLQPHQQGGESGQGRPQGGADPRAAAGRRRREDRGNRHPSRKQRRRRRHRREDGQGHPGGHRHGRLHLRADGPERRLPAEIRQLRAGRLRQRPRRVQDPSRRAAPLPADVQDPSRGQDPAHPERFRTGAARQAGKAVHDDHDRRPAVQVRRACQPLPQRNHRRHQGDDRRRLERRPLDASVRDDPGRHRPRQAEPLERHAEYHGQRQGERRIPPVLPVHRQPRPQRDAHGLRL